MGLEGVVAAATRLSSVDGQAGELIIAGFPLEALAPHAHFEQTVFLLWNDRLASTEELATFQADLAAQRELTPLTAYVVAQAAQQGISAMDAVRMGVGTLASSDNLQHDALRLVAQLPTIVATYWRTRNNQPVLAPRAELSHAANMLWMLHGTEPDEQQVRALETYLNTVVDHGLNASTFTARVIIATQSDLVSAIVGAVGALKGPLHGGAPGPALDMVFEIGTPERAEPFLREKLERGERLMGFGHRVYKVRDPRATVLAQAAERLFAGAEDRSFYDLVQHVEHTAVSLLAQYKPGRNLQTNVEFYTALLLHSLGLSTELFTPTFTISRVAGWIAHAFEQRETGRLIRPQSIYTGTKDRRWHA